mmetsp:Transcript_2352/g.4113  ORF Transcript_2352/g.4113 Transcript_2352/m.4113 type:complete len:83 (+) Transcript_2352:613-861(+)
MDTTNGRTARTNTRRVVALVLYGSENRVLEKLKSSVHKVPEYLQNPKKNLKLCPPIASLLPASITKVQQNEDQEMDKKRQRQ